MLQVRFLRIRLCLISTCVKNVVRVCMCVCARVCIGVYSVSPYGTISVNRVFYQSIRYSASQCGIHSIPYSVRVENIELFHKILGQL